MSRLLINEPPLMVLPSLAAAIGLQEAIVVQQVHYWLGATKPRDDGSRWVFNTYDQWAEQFPFWSAEAVRKIFKSLREKGLIKSRPRGNHAFDKVNEYTIDYGALAKLTPARPENSPDRPVKFSGSERENPPDGLVKNSASIRENPPVLYTETTTETTTETLTEKKERKRSHVVQKPVDVSAEVWESFKLVRRSKKAAITDLAMLGIRREAVKAGYTLEDALTTCCERGWAGFKAEWVKDDRRQAAAPMETFRERDERLARERWEKATGVRHPDSQPINAGTIIDVTPTATINNRIPF